MNLLFQSPELEYRHEVVGRLNKYDTEVKVEVIPRNQHTNANTTPPPIGHSLNTIYDNYGNDCNFGKMPSSPENDLNAYNLSMQVNKIKMQSELF